MGRRPGTELLVADSGSLHPAQAEIRRNAGRLANDLDAAALRRALAAAERSRIAEYRAEEEARIQRTMTSS